MKVFFIISVTILMFVSAFAFNNSFFNKYLYSNDKTNKNSKKLFLCKIFLITAYFASMILFIAFDKAATSLRVVTYTLFSFSLFFLLDNDKYFKNSSQNNILTNIKRRNIIFIILICVNCVSNASLVLFLHRNLLFLIPIILIFVALIIISCVLSRIKTKREIEKITKE